MILFNLQMKKLIIKINLSLINCMENEQKKIRIINNHNIIINIYKKYIKGCNYITTCNYGFKSLKYNNPKSLINNTFLLFNNFKYKL